MTRTAMHAYIDPDKYELWKAAAAKHSITLTALIQAIADDIDDIINDSIVAKARAIQTARLNRGWQ